MAGGKHSVDRVSESRLPAGSVVTGSGRISVATELLLSPPPYPFATMDLISLDDTLTYASRQSKARFAVYIGDLGPDAAGRAREILAEVPTANNAVLLAVSPNQRSIEVVYGADVSGRGAESAAALGLSAAASSFRAGDNLIDGLISAIRVMSAGIDR
ncbi:MAG: DUF5130 family protein [Mycobacterium sp.]|nr:DUF5130 family protein [Mycobacterium sp.]